MTPATAILAPMAWGPRYGVWAVFYVHLELARDSLVCRVGEASRPGTRPAAAPAAPRPGPPGSRLVVWTGRVVFVTR